MGRTWAGAREQGARLISHSDDPYFYRSVQLSRYKAREIPSFPLAITYARASSILTLFY